MVSSKVLAPVPASVHISGWADTEGHNNVVVTVTRLMLCVLHGCRALLRRYPDFPDMRAALAAADWSIGKLGDAESNYQRLNDPRYRDRQWLKVNRRWPPKLLSAWEAFLDIKKVDSA